MKKHFKFLEAAIDFLMTLKDSEEIIEICLLSPDENDRISKEEDIDDSPMVMQMCMSTLIFQPIKCQ